MSTHTGEILSVGGTFDVGALWAGTLRRGFMARSARKAFVVWLVLEEIMIYSQSDF